MPRPIYTANSRRIFIGGLIVALFVLGGLLLAKRPLERSIFVQTPDEKHAHQVYAKHPLRTEFIAHGEGLSSIHIAIQRKGNFSELDISAKVFQDTREIPSTLKIEGEEMRISFNPQAQSKGKVFTVTLETPSLPKQHAIYIPYESDNTKYPTNKVWQGDNAKQGSLGITQYGRPTLALLMSEWLFHQDQRALWVGIGLCILAWKIPTNKVSSTLSKQTVSVVWPTILWLIILAMYYPATQLFFYSDDVPILARTAMMWNEQPGLLFTPHQYQDADPRAAFGFDFWRPISFAVYPLLLHLLFPPSAALYYFFNIAFFGLVGCFLFYIANILLKSKPASFFAVTVWAASSSKLGVVYWWSSIQDILASLFAMGSIVLFYKWRATKEPWLMRIAILSYALAMLSKEYVIVVPIAILFMEFVLEAQQKEQSPWKQKITLIRPFIYTTGLFLIINTVVLGDPTLPPPSSSNQTYAFSISPSNIARNVLVYLSATAESRMWPRTPMIEENISQALRLWEAKTSGPYYPGLVVGLLLIALVIWYWKNKGIRSLLLFGAAWWFLFMGPILLLGHDWKIRWLMLATFGSAIILATIVRSFSKKNNMLPYALSLLCVIYGITNARDPELTRFYREQSAYTQHAYKELIRQEKMIGEVKRIILVGIDPDQQTSLNAYLFRLYAKNPHADIMYRDSDPAIKEQTDVVINMTGIIPYYPESEK
jgi:hypothetical protein